VICEFGFLLCSAVPRWCKLLCCKHVPPYVASSLSSTCFDSSYVL
jgi:hypothetical protein